MKMKNKNNPSEEEEQPTAGTSLGGLFPVPGRRRTVADTIVQRKRLDPKGDVGHARETTRELPKGRWPLPQCENPKE